MKPYYVLIWDVNKRDLVPFDIMPYFKKCWKEDLKREVKLWGDLSNPPKNMPETFEEFKKFILAYSMYEFWSRCEYEFIVSEWPSQTIKKKIDVHYQITANIDVITTHFMNNYEL